MKTRLLFNMRNGIKLFLIGALGLTFVRAAGAAEEKSELKDQKAKVSYSLGMNMGQYLKRGGFDVDLEVLTTAMKDVLTGKELKLSEQQAREVMMAYQKELSAKREEERAQKAEKNRKEGETFLAENQKKPGVKTHTVTLPDGKTAELQYKVLTEGNGATPGSNDVVSINYRGTLINGTEYDSSVKRGQAAKFPINGVIKGWSEALKMMKVGSKWQLFIPSTLAYGDRASGQIIEPGSTLILDVELVASEPQAPPAPAQPLTSDIIKVPSAEELKKGAKIEVIKPEEVEKKIKEEKEKKP